MGNYMILAITVLTVVPIVFGILLGLLRGSRRALLRLILVVLCVALAFALCGTLAKSVLTAEVTQTAEDGSEMTVTLQEYLQNMLGEDMKDMADYIVPLVQSLVKVILFLMLFFVFQLLTWIIVYPLCKLFVKPKRVTGSDGRRRTKKRRLIGAAIGLVQGVVVAVCVCIIINGFFAIGSDLNQVVNGFSEISESTSGNESGEPEEVAMLADDEGSNESANDGEASGFGDLSALFDEYNESLFGKMYNAIGSKPFTWISKVTTDDGRTVTLTGQVEAFRGLVDIGKEFIKITDLNFDNLYADDNISTLTGILNNVQTIKEGLSEEAGETVSGMLSTLGDAMGVDVNKFYNLNFADEAAAFDKLSQYKDKDFSSMSPEEIHEAAKDLVKDLSKSELLMDLLVEQDIDIGNGLSDAQRDEVDGTLDEMVQSGDIDAATAERLRDIFGFNYNNGGDGEQKTTETPEFPELTDELGFQVRA